MGGAVYDLLHILAARKCGAKQLVTLNAKEFARFSQDAGPEVIEP